MPYLAAIDAPPRHLETFARALQAGRALRIAYRALRGEETLREVMVLALAFRGGAWLAACECRLRGSLRAFRVDRVLEARPAGLAAPATSGFDARAFALQALQAPAGAPLVRVAIRLAPPLAELSGALLPGLAVLDGAARVVHFRASRPEAVIALALSLGRAAELVLPGELARVARRLRDRVDGLAPAP